MGARFGIEEKAEKKKIIKFQGERKKRNLRRCRCGGAINMSRRKKVKKKNKKTKKQQKT